MNIKYWIEAMRLHTLPLSLSSIGMGGFLAAYYDQFKTDIFLLCIITTIFLQILSNLANDYGDSIHGADNISRIGPKRVVQKKQISQTHMKYAVYSVALLCLLSGSYLIYTALEGFKILLFFLCLGIIAIMSAIFYTSGTKPYGYIGLGDLAVMLFFGWIAVLGTYFLLTQRFR